jgi:hypothetical protein
MTHLTFRQCVHFSSNLDVRPRRWHLPAGHRHLVAMLCVLGLGSAGCGSIKNLNIYRDDTNEPQYQVYRTPDEEKVEVQYLGVGGFLVRRGGDSILFAPSFTNPSIFAMPPWARIRSDKELVARCLQKARTQWGNDPLKDVQFILVGHAHYDHLLDVPTVMKYHAPQALAVGSRTMSHILAGAELATRSLVADACSAPVGGAMGRWIYNAKRTVRVLALESEHSPHLANFKFMTGHYTADRTELPDTALKWKEGQTYAYLVDFLTQDESGERIDFRIHYQDAASRETYALVPQAAQEGYPRVDLAITCVGASQTTKTYPGPQLQSTKPRHIIFGHWENFFDNQSCEGDDPEPRVVIGADIPEFTRRVDDNKPQDAISLMPFPYSTMYFPRVPGAFSAALRDGEECPVRPGQLPGEHPSPRNVWENPFLSGTGPTGR